MRVEGVCVMNDSQQGVPVTVLLIPERTTKRRGDSMKKFLNKPSTVEKCNTLMQSTEVKLESYSLFHFLPNFAVPPVI